MRLLWLADVLRAAGLTVHEVSGWKTRGSDTFDPRGLVCHATAGSASSTDAGEINVLLNGSSSAPPPISQLYLSRSGAYHVVASGRCNHALTGQQGTPLQGLGNTNLIGIEAQNDNRGQAWTSVQIDAYTRGVAAICRRMGWTAGRVVAHREHQPSGKTDPVGIDMPSFRRSVASLIGDSQGGDMQLGEPVNWGTQFLPNPEGATVGPWLGGTIGNQWQHIRETTYASYIMDRLNAARITALTSVIENLARVITSGEGSIPVGQILAGVDQRLQELAQHLAAEQEELARRLEEEQRDAVADLGEGGAAQVRADA